LSEDDRSRTKPSRADRISTRSTCVVDVLEHVKDHVIDQVQVQVDDNDNVIPGV